MELTKEEKLWQEKVYPYLKLAKDNCAELGIPFKWECLVGEKVFSFQQEGDRTFSHVVKGHV